MKVIPLVTDINFQLCILDLIKSAEANDELTISYFSIRNDSYGNDFLRHLQQAALRCAKVTLILDDYGSMHREADGTDFSSLPLDPEQILTLEEAGVHIRLYHPIETTKKFHYSNLKDWSNFSRRNHNKLFVFNLKSLQKRGIVIGDSQWAKDHFNGNMQGSNIYIEDISIYSEALSYLIMLLNSEHVKKYYYENLSRDKANYYDEYFKIPCEFDQYSWSWYQKDKIINPEAIKFVYSDIEFVKPKKRHTIQNYEIDLLRRAKEKVLYCTPYFSPDIEMQDELIRCFKLKTQNISILIGKYKHDPYLPYGVKKASSRLLKNSLKIKEFIGRGNIHYKDMVVDDYVFIKSANGEGRSRFYNLESGVIIKSKELSEVISKRIEVDLSTSVSLSKSTKFLEEHHFIIRPLKLLLRPFFYKHL